MKDIIKKSGWRKMKTKQKILGIMTGIFLLGCSHEANEEVGVDDPSGSEEAALEMEEDGEFTGSDSADTEEDAAPDEAEESGEENDGENLIGERVIRTASVEYETLDFEETTSHIMNVVNEHGAYVEYSDESSYTSSGTSGGNDSNRQYRRVDYTLRVPVEALTDFLNDLDDGEAYKVNEQIGSEDVTQTYRDIEARVGVLQNKENRLSELLEQAESIEDIMTIEDNLSETIAERESLQSRLETYDDLIDFSTVHVTVEERPRVAEAREDSPPFWQRAQDTLTDSFYTFYYWIQDALIGLISVIPQLVVVTLLGFVGWIVYKRINNKKQK